MPQAVALDEQALNTMPSVAGRISGERLRHTLLASPQTASIYDQMMRPGRVGLYGRDTDR
jgi:hypothetical protein